MKNIAIAASIGLGALALAGCSSTQEITVTGTVTTDWGTGNGISGEGHGGQKCLMDPSGGYADIVDGAQVLLLDSHGEPVAKGRLSAGETSDEDMKYCVFPFEISEAAVEEGSLYSVQISHRDGPTYSVDELQAPLELSLF